MAIRAISSKTIRDNSYLKFIGSRSNATIKAKIFIFLRKNPSRAYTAKQLQELLFIKYRSSVCNPLAQLVHIRAIRVADIVYDSDTHREVGAYQIAPNLFTKAGPND